MARRGAPRAPPTPATSRPGVRPLAARRAAALCAFSTSRRAAAGERSAIYRSRVGAGHRELDPLLRLLVRLFGGTTLRELGYR